MLYSRTKTAVVKIMHIVIDAKQDNTTDLSHGQRSTESVFAGLRKQCILGLVKSAEFKRSS